MSGIVNLLSKRKIQFLIIFLLLLFYAYQLSPNIYYQDAKFIALKQQYDNLIDQQNEIVKTKDRPLVAKINSMEVSAESLSLTKQLVQIMNEEQTVFNKRVGVQKEMGTLRLSAIHKEYINRLGTLDITFLDLFQTSLKCNEDDYKRATEFLKSNSNNTFVDNEASTCISIVNEKTTKYQKDKNSLKDFYNNNNLGKTKFYWGY